VVLTEGAPQNPAYIQEEREALREYLKRGGGLILSGSRLKPDQVEEWSLNVVLAEYGARVLSGQERHAGRSWPVLDVSNEWEVVLKGETGKPVYARRAFGKGRVALFASSGLFRFDRKNREESAAKADFLVDAIKWAASGSPPVGGEPRLPAPMAGGGGIYQESELRLDGIVCYYSKNQTPELLRTVREDFPRITEDLYAWCPSPKPEQPMYLVLCSGGGGGWAVNAYLPKEASTISTSPDGIRSIFGHEQAHTMSGPCSVANHPFGGNQGEEHAGWFQGKINAKYNGAQGPNRGCHKVFRSDYDGTQKEPEGIFRKDHLDNWRTGWDRLMIWYVWQKLDDRYGPTWYPRWRWVQGERWKATPGRKLSWEEAIEDMSIAVGEDLFPFFKKTGKQLSKERFEKVEFGGSMLTLPIAPIEPTPPGDVRLDPIGDYTKPLKRQRLDYALVSRDDSVTCVKSGKTDEVLFHSPRPREAIQWAMSRCGITIIGSGKYTLLGTVEVPRANISLVISEKAELVMSPEAKPSVISEGHGDYWAVIHNSGRDNVSIVNLGSLRAQGGAGIGAGYGAGIIVEGRSGGQCGVDGGLVFSSGRLAGFGDAVWVVDAKNVKAPLIWSEAARAAVLAIEGCEDLEIGTVVDLRGGDTPNEAIDFNSYSTRVRVGRAIGTAPCQEVVDINNSPECVIEEIVAYGKTRLVSNNIYPPTGRRLTQKPHIRHSDGTVVNKQKTVDRRVKLWKRHVEVRGLPETLPRLTVRVRLTAVFDDGSEERALEKAYELELSTP
jgi:hypothetical protein